MMRKKITRKDFLRMAGFVAFTALALPGLNKLKLFKKPHKEAKYYKNLAG